MEILSVESKEFQKYGRVIRNIDFKDLVDKMQEMPMPGGVVYEPSVPELEKLPVMAELSRIFYGEMPIQIGYCNGHNTRLNGLEYHRSSEVNVAATDAVLLLGQLAEVEEDFTYDTAKVQGFFLPAGTGVELYATTLHYAPCGPEGKGFLVSIVLPRGTNGPLEGKHDTVAAEGSAPSEDALLTAVNKWLIGHPQGGHPQGTFLGLKGENTDIG